MTATKTPSPEDMARKAYPRTRADRLGARDAYAGGVADERARMAAVLRARADEARARGGACELACAAEDDALRNGLEGAP